MAKSNRANSIAEAMRAAGKQASIQWVKPVVGRGYWQTSCACGHEEGRHLSPVTPFDILLKKFRQAGWRVGRGVEPQCPACRKLGEPEPEVPAVSEEPRRVIEMSDSRTQCRKKVPFEIVQQAMEQLGVARNADMSRLLNLSDGAVGEWARVGEAPAWAELACHGLLAMQEAPQQDEILVIRLPQNKKSPVETVLDAMGVKFSRV